MIKVIDEQKTRTRRKSLHYVLEGGILRHISDYATSFQKIGDKRTRVIEYEVPEERLLGKTIYEFHFTNRAGSLLPEKFPAEDLTKGYAEQRRKSVNAEELRELSFEVKSLNVASLLQDGEFVRLMIEELKEFERKFLPKGILASERVGDYLTDFKWGEVACLCNYPEKARQGSLEETYKLLHQLWALKIIHEALNVVKIEEESWFIEQGKEWPISIFLSDKGEHYTCWYEPQIIKEAPQGYTGPLCDIFEGRVVWKRPDLLVSKGKLNSLLEAGKFDALIECKNLSFERWWRNGAVVEEELKPYKQLFKPDLFILASWKPVNLSPEDERILEDLSIRVIEDFYPRGGGIGLFSEIIRKELNS